MNINLRNILSLGFGLAVWAVAIGTAQAQFGGLQIQIGGGPFGRGPLGGPFGGFGVPFGVGPSIPLGSPAYMGPQYQSAYRGYYGSFGVAPSLGVYGPSLNYSSPAYGGYGYSNQSSLDPLLAQQYALQRQQLELQAAQRSLSSQQTYGYDRRSTYSVQSPRGLSSTPDLRPGMVLPDGSTVVSVGPVSPTGSAPSSSAPEQLGAPQSRPQQPTVAPPVPRNLLPSDSSESKKAAF